MRVSSPSTPRRPHSASATSLSSGPWGRSAWPSLGTTASLGNLHKKEKEGEGGRRREKEGEVVRATLLCVCMRRVVVIGYDLNVG